MNKGTLLASAAACASRELEPAAFKPGTAAQLRARVRDDMHAYHGRIVQAQRVDAGGMKRKALTGTVTDAVDSMALSMRPLAESWRKLAETMAEVLTEGGLARLTKFRTESELSDGQALSLLKLEQQTGGQLFERALQLRPQLDWPLAVEAARLEFIAKKKGITP